MTSSTSTRTSTSAGIGAGAPAAGGAAAEPARASSSAPLDGPWRDPALPAVERAAALVAAMTLEEKTAQLFGIWVGASADGAEVAPHQHDMAEPVSLDELLPTGLGQLTRPFGTAPVEAVAGARSLARTQRTIVESGRFGVPALAHEECLAGFAAWGATAYPVPLSWGASFDPELVREMAARIGDDLRSVGVHQGLAPVLDVVRDARWGRVEETIGEDPHLVGTVATAYVQGLESAGVVATLKHFAGYSASRAGRNLAPVSMGRRELADVVLPPFEMAVALGGVRSVMHAYTDIDGVPSAADESLLTGLLRDTWGFDGTVVADYFGVAFLETLHGVAGSRAEAAGLALAAGVDVELPTVDAFGPALVAAVRAGEVDEALIDRAALRVLTQKAELGLLDPGWDPEAPLARADDIDLDTAGNRALARRLADEAVVLLRNDGVLPLAGALPLTGAGSASGVGRGSEAGRGTAPRLAVVGPNADTSAALLGCYSFPAHVGSQHPDVAVGIELPTFAERLREAVPGLGAVVAGCDVDGTDASGIPAAVEAARDVDVALVVLGDRAGLFGRGTSGEGCDAVDLALPGVQQQLLDAVLDTGTPTVVVLFTGRPYALGRAATEAAAVVQAFFPGEEGAAAVVDVLTGATTPSGRLPVSVPAHPGAQPSTYLQSPLAARSAVSDVDPTPAFGFGHGLSYTTFGWDVVVPGGGDGPLRVPTVGEVALEVTVHNTGDRIGADVVQVYLHDPVAETVRPGQRLVAYGRTPQLAPGEQAVLEIVVPVDLASATGRDGLRRIETGALQLRVARSSSDVVAAVDVEVTGEARVVDHTRRLTSVVTVR
ncbi:beta-glucosidase [Frigoribacterium sp. CFBP 13707]|uniref:beta-xylosidase/alpha-l-arabinosidase n=1 Tax=Frigoribacterium sp. CFBP 13707 TaxID=2775313 RepID=UPI0017815DB4|nr:glycoside hydrolase family 3 N-terminal domain-containing protein [Frigoribacterium sp. CFBP 13707]MBD8729188.1 glycoside hydrolase family 3 C-terminal domain-containing protein [Frigoribacterium sp. CFBP 13707]